MTQFEHAVKKQEEIESLRAELNSFKKSFPNGFESWHETHFEIVRGITLTENLADSEASKQAYHFGTGGLYDWAKLLTDEFENLHKGKEWGIDEDALYQEAIEKFLNEKL